LAERISRAGQQTIRDHFSMDRMVDATERVYHSLLERRGHPAVSPSSEFACK
jgi:hypothetical protein